MHNIQAWLLKTQSKMLQTMECDIKWSQKGILVTTNFPYNEVTLANK